MNMNNFFVKLKNRGLIQIEGEDRYGFLQSLISNDVELLKTQPSTYACLLTPQGKFLHDFFVIKGNGFLLIDCEGGNRAQDLYKRLNLYRLRAKVKISVEEHNEVYAVLPPLIPPASGGARGGELQDHRHPEIGMRCFEKPLDMEEQEFEEWDKRRISLTIPDGSRDMITQKSTLLECNIDKLNGVSFKKGCYVGQELTARMHHRGLAKKHLYCIKGDNLPAYGADIEANGTFVGEMRSSCGTVGLALLKDALTEKLAQDIILC